MIQPIQTQSLVVLIVDDVPDNVAVLHDALDESGYTVLVANNGQCALEVATKAEPDVILLDAMMPGMDGFEVCRKLKANNQTSQIPVIFMTGLTESEHVVAAFKAGGTDYVTKPVRVNEVLVRMMTHMQTSRQVHEARSVLDAFGQAAIAITPQNGKIVWQTPLARDWMNSYFLDENGLSEVAEAQHPIKNH
jgi:CheY-like chemotaxis protein